MSLPVTVGMEEEQIRSSIMLMPALPMVQCEGLLALDDLSAERAVPCLLPQECCTKRRGPLQRSVTVAILDVALPGRIERMRVALDLEVTLGLDRCLSTEELCAGRRSGEAPGFARLRGKGALGDPASRCVWVAELGPAREPSPDETIAVRTRLTPEAVTVRVGPTSEEGMQRLDALGRGGPCGVVTERCDCGGHGLHTGLAGCQLSLRRCAVGARMLTDRLPEEVNALCERCADRLVGGEPHPACGEKGVDRRQDGVGSPFPCVGRDHTVIGPSHVVDLVHPAMPVPPVHDACEAVEHSSTTDDGRNETALGHSCRGRKERAAIPKATSEPCGQEPLGHGEVLCEPRQGDVIAQPFPIPCQDPGGRRVLAEDGAALRSSIGASAFRTEPIGMGIRRGFGNRLEGLEMDGLPRSILSRRDGEGALDAIFLRHREAVQRSWAVTTPLTDAVDSGGGLLWRIPALVVDPRRLCAGVLGHSSDGESARGTRVRHQRAQALALAPRSCLHCLDDPPLQGPYPTVTRCPIALVPAPCRQARGRVEFHGLPLRHCASVSRVLRLPRPVTPAGSQPPFSVGQHGFPSPPHDRMAFACSRVPSRLHRLPRLRMGDSRGFGLAQPWRGHPASHVSRGSPTSRGRRPLDTGRVNGCVRVPFKRATLPSMPFWRWGRMVALAPPASRCVTPRLQWPSPYRLLPDGHTMCHS